MSRSALSLASSHTEVHSMDGQLRSDDRDVDLEKQQAEKIDQGPISLESPASPPTPSPDSDQTTRPGPAEAPPGPSGDSGTNDLYQPRSSKFWSILASNFLAMFLVALDRTIVATAIPKITDDFHSLGDIGWYGSAYMLTTAASQLLFGRLYKHYNMKWVFLIAIGIFEVGSAICGAAPNSQVFILGRAVAGIGSAGIFSGAMMIMIPMIPLHKRPMFQSMFGMVFGISSVLGPLVGGAFTKGATWRWCFYINLPIGGFALIFMLFFWNPPPRKTEPAPFFTHIKRLDPLGTLFFVPSIVCLLLALQWGGSTYAWSSWRIILLFVLFGVLAIAFAVVQVLTPETATIPVRIITQRSVICATLFTFFISGSMLVLIYYMPVWFQTVKLIDPLKSGIYTLPLVLSLVAASTLGGIFTQKIGYYVPAMLFCPMVMAVGEGLLSTLTRSSSQASWVGFQFLSGFGLGSGMQTGSLVVQTVLPMPDVPMAIALIFFVQQLGGAVATSMGQTILSNLLISRLAGIPGIDPEQIVNNGATELTAIVPAQDIDTVIGVYDYTLTRIFLAAMGMALAALLAATGVEWRTIKKGKPGHGGPGVRPPPLSGAASAATSSAVAVQRRRGSQDTQVSCPASDVELDSIERK